MPRVLVCYAGCLVVLLCIVRLQCFVVTMETGWMFFVAPFTCTSFLAVFNNPFISVIFRQNLSNNICSKFAKALTDGFLSLELLLIVISVVSSSKYWSLSSLGEDIFFSYEGQ